MSDAPSRVSPCAFSVSNALHSSDGTSARALRRRSGQENVLVRRNDVVECAEPEAPAGVLLLSRLNDWRAVGVRVPHALRDDVAVDIEANNLRIER